MTIQFENQQFTWNNITEVIDAFYMYATNRRYNDKSSCAYFVGMIKGHNNTIYLSYNKRQEIDEVLLDALNEKTIYNVLKSEYTCNAVWNILKDRKLKGII